VLGDGAISWWILNSVKDEFSEQDTFQVREASRVRVLFYLNSTDVAEVTGYEPPIGTQCPPRFSFAEGYTEFEKDVVVQVTLSPPVR